MVLVAAPAATLAQTAGQIVFDPTEINRTDCETADATIELDVRAVGRRELESVEAEIMAIASSSTVPDVTTSVELVFSPPWDVRMADIAALQQLGLIPR